jgi:hypothetical protein
MTTSSFALQHVLNTYQRNLKHGEHPSPESAKRRQPDFKSMLEKARAGVNTAPNPRTVRERFGQGAVRDYKSSWLETYRKIQDLG